MDKRLYELTRERHLNEAELHAMLEVFGYELAKREGYNVHEGLDAIHWYLIQQHHWTPAVVKSLSFEDLHFLLAEEKFRWTLPKELRPSNGPPGKQSSRSKSRART